MAVLNIKDEDYSLILSYIGAPFLSIDDGFELDDAQIKETIIKPVLHRFFSFFPIYEEAQYQVGAGTFEFPYPDEYTFTVMDGRLTNYMNTLTPSTIFGGNPLVTRLGLSEFSGRYGTQRSYGEEATRATRAATNDALVNLYKVFRFEPQDQNNKVIGYSSMPATVCFKWAKYSDNFNNVSFHKKYEVRQLAGAELLLWFGNLRAQTVEDFPVKFNFETMLERGNALKDEVLEKWTSYSRGAAMR